jgi:rubrerythrin
MTAEAKKTDDNLKEAFAGESQANRKYLFFAEKADKEGQAQIARLFRAAAAAETVHAKNHLEVLKGIMSTGDNLKAAMGGEHHEFTRMYPAMIEQADKEKNEAAERSFNLANTVEQIHHRLYQDALSALEGGRKMKDEPYFVCQICGNTVAGSAPDKCPVCGARKGMFKEVT